MTHPWPNFTGGQTETKLLNITHMMTSSNGSIFCVTGHLCGNSPVPVNSPPKGQWRGALMFSLICVWINDWVNKGEAGDLRRYHAHCDVTVMRNNENMYKFRQSYPWLQTSTDPVNCFNHLTRDLRNTRGNICVVIAPWIQKNMGWQFL